MGVKSQALKWEIILIAMFTGLISSGLSCTQGAIRLQGGTSSQGRVEVCHNNTWGTVCDDLWDTPDAQVVCRQLGFNVAGAVAHTTGFTNGAGQIWLDKVQCHGTETRLIDCPASSLGSHNCGHIEDAGVSCHLCTQGAIRLLDGNSTQGRLEVCNNNVWGTVCDDLWGTLDAQVACRQLGFDAASAVAITLEAVPDGTGQIWLDNVNCVGTETRLIDCPANSLGSHNCAHSEDAGVSCSVKKSFKSVRIYNYCPSSQVIRELTADIYSFFSSNYGVPILGLLYQNPAESCAAIRQDSPLHQSGLYWIRTDSGVEQQICNFE